MSAIDLSAIDTTPYQQKLLVADPQVIQDGLHNLIQTPVFQDAMRQALTQFFGGVFEPSLIEQLRRFVAQGDRNTSRSFSVRNVANGGPTKLLERDPSRVFALVSNLGAATVFVGDRQVTAGAPNDPSGGIPIPTNNYPPFILQQDIGELWAISANDGMDVRILDVAGGV